MHSVYKIKKAEQEKEVQARLAIRSQSASPDAHREKTRRLAERSEIRLDEWLMGNARVGVETLEEQKLACNHKFRDRLPAMELGNSAVSPARYVCQTDRIETTIKNQMIMRDRYKKLSQSEIFRQRDQVKEIQPRLKFASCTEDDRINNAITMNPAPPPDFETKSKQVMPLQPWTPYDHPSRRKFRDDNSSKNMSSKDFDIYRRAGGGYPHDFLNASEAFKRAFGSKIDDFRPRQRGTDLGGEFRNVVPGFHTDNIPGKWKMDLSLYNPRSPRILSPKTIEAQNSRWQAGGTTIARMSEADLLSSLRFRKTEKEYWKSGNQVSAAHPQFVESYEAIGARQFDTYTERASTARSMVLEHMGHKPVGPKTRTNSKTTPHESNMQRKNRPSMLNTGDFSSG